MKQDNKKIATDLIENFGGKDNITEVINCMTRVRVKVVDESKVNFKEIEKIDGVLGVLKGEQIQIVTGPGKSEKIAKEMSNMANAKFSEEMESDIEKRTRENKAKVKEKQNKSKFKSFSATIASIFVPLIPAFVGAGLIGGIASVMQNMITAGSLSQENFGAVLQVLNIIKTGLYG